MSFSDALYVPGIVVLTILALLHLVLEPAVRSEGLHVTAEWDTSDTRRRL